MVVPTVGILGIPELPSLEVFDMLPKFDLLEVKLQPLMLGMDVSWDNILKKYLDLECVRTKASAYSVF